MHAEDVTDPRNSAFVRAASSMNASTADEREQAIWNEATGIAYQMLLFGILALCAVAIWTVGEPARLFVLGGALLAGGSSLLVFSYARRFGVQLQASAGRVGPIRIVLWLALMAAFVVGVMTDGGRGGVVAELDAATVAGLATGVGFTVIVGAVGIWLAGRRAPRGEE